MLNDVIIGGWRAGGDVAVNAIPDDEQEDNKQATKH